VARTAAGSDGPAASPGASSGREGVEWADVQSDARRRGGLEGEEGWR